MTTEAVDTTDHDDPSFRKLFTHNEMYCTPLDRIRSESMTKLWDIGVSDFKLIPPFAQLDAEIDSPTA
jgi:hypothetical protein